MNVRLTIRGAQYAASTEKSLLVALETAGITDIDAPCGGKGRCGKCAVTVTGPVRSLDTGTVHPAERELLLACRFAPAGDAEVELSAAEKIQIAATETPELFPCGEGLGAAADIGTTTVAVLLYDLSAGAFLGSAGRRNVQRTCGADIISRITACGEGKLPLLRDSIRDQIRDLTDLLCRKAGRDISELRRTVIAGNTVMEHLYAGVDPAGIGVAPFTPASLFGDHRTEIGSCADTYFCPCVSGYVGGDITAGLWASGGALTEALWLYVDIGTNGEMALGSREGYLSCATAAGPAFEGAEIACGMDGSPGAIDRVTAEDGDITVHVIGGRTAAGLCGSGLIDAVAALLDLGVIDETGRMAEKDELPPPLASRLFALEDGMAAFRLAGNVYLSSRDVRQVQLAKAAIRAGAETLLARCGKQADDIAALVIAGGFGSFIDKYSALRIGLLPRVNAGRICHVGNAAAAGAAMALTAAGEAQLMSFTNRIRYLELATDSDFMDRYISCMMFGEEGSDPE